MRSSRSTAGLLTDPAHLSRRAMLSAFASLAACAKRKPSEPIRVLVTRYLYMSSVYLAEESGYFEKEGLRIEIREEPRNTSGGTTIPLLASGEADAAFLAISAALVNSIARGANVRVVAGRQHFSTTCPDYRRLHGSLQAFPNGFDNVRQIKGKRVSSAGTAGTSDFVFSTCLKAAGLTRSDVTLVKVRDQEAAALLSTGKIDVAFSASDDLSLSALRERVVPGPSYASILPNFMNSYVLFGKKLLDGPTEQGARFLRAFLRGGRDFVAGKDPQFLRDLVVQNGWDPARVAKLCRTNIALDGNIPLHDMQRFIDWSVEEGFTPSPIRAEQMVDQRFLNELRKV